MKIISLFCLVLYSLLVLLPGQVVHAGSNEVILKEWELKWIDANEAANAAPPAAGSWLAENTDQPTTFMPDGSVGMWLHIRVPPTADWRGPGLLIERMYGLDIAVYNDSRLLYESKRDFLFERNKLLLPIEVKSHPTDLYVRILSKIRVGPGSGIRIGEFEALSDRFIRQGLPDLLFGASISFLGLIVLLCSSYLNKRQRGLWISFGVVALSTGLLIVTYSQLPYIYFKEYGDLFLTLFDLSMFTLFPALNFYTNQVFNGKFMFFTRYAKVQAGYSLFCIVVVIFYKVTGEQYLAVYNFFTSTILGPMILLQLILITVLAIVFAIKGNKDALLFAIGIMVLALSGAMDLTLYYVSETKYVLILWKFGVAVLIVTLVIILVRRVSADYSRLLSYSKELELYNHRLQRTEKLKIISDLAASVAHEIRNPLQVTRGFLQLLVRKSTEENSHYFNMAIHELDRASVIITDFLTFAKPEIDSSALLHLSEEMRKIETIIGPLAAMHGGKLLVQIADDLFIQGNTSKLKQALINIIKNSIEAIRDDGVIKMEAYSEHETVIVRISDNGEGMTEEQLAKLGVPFFSTKAKGTGLGLMVTFRIIEVMQGTLEFRSESGKGTEAIIRFPLARLDSVPDNVRA